MRLLRPMVYPFTLAAALAAATGPAWAQTAPQPSKVEKVEEAFTRADGNKDGKLSREEAGVMPVIAQNFDAIDADKDGFLSRDEFVAKVTAGQ